MEAKAIVALAFLFEVATYIQATGPEQTLLHSQEILPCFPFASGAIKIF